MKTKNLICLLAALSITMTMSFPAWAQQAEKIPGPISEKEFAVLLGATFPGYAPAPPIISDCPLTYTCALAVLCEAVGYGGQSNAANLALAIENDLITGLAAIGSRTVTPEDA